jgi:hypothetical protein
VRIKAVGISGGVWRFRDTPARRKAPKPALQLIRLDDRGLTDLPRGQRPVAYRFENPRPADTRRRSGFVGTEAQPWDGAACYIWLNRHGTSLRFAVSSRTQWDTSKKAKFDGVLKYTRYALRLLFLVASRRPASRACRTMSAVMLSLQFKAISHNAPTC